MRAWPLTRPSAPSPPAKAPSSTTANASSLAAGSVKQLTSQKQKGQAHKACPRETSKLKAILNKQFLFLLQRLLWTTPIPAAARPQKIQPHLNPLHQRGYFLHRTPDTVGKFRSRILHRL